MNHKKALKCVVRDLEILEMKISASTVKEAICYIERLENELNRLSSVVLGNEDVSSIKYVVGEMMRETKLHAGEAEKGITMSENKQPQLGCTDVIMPCRCEREVTSNGWQWYQCNRTATFIWTRDNGEQIRVCGIHARGRKGCVRIEVEE